MYFIKTMERPADQSYKDFQLKCRVPLKIKNLLVIPIYCIPISLLNLSFIVCSGLGKRS